MFVRAPWWVLSLVAAGFVGVAGLVVVVRTDGLGLGTVAMVVVTAAVVGLLVGPLSTRVNARYAAALAPLSRDQERCAWRAAARGPVPADPEVRAAAARIVGVRLGRAAREQLWLPLAGSAAILCVVPALVSRSPSVGVALVILVVLCVFLIRAPKVLARRLRLLGRPPPELAVPADPGTVP